VEYFGAVIPEVVSRGIKMGSNPFTVEIRLDTGGVRSVRVLGKDWEQGSEAHALLQRLSPLIQQLDTTAKGFGHSSSTHKGVIQ
jgi:hypothetical protein